MVEVLRRGALAALLGWLGAVAAAEAATTYGLTLIGLAPKVGGLRTAWVNASGQVAGNAYLKADPKVIDGRMYAWSDAGGVVTADNGDPKATTLAAGIDARGQVAGTYIKPRWPDRVVVWNGSEGYRVVGHGRATGSSSNGHIVGFSEGLPTLWTADGRNVPIRAPFHDGWTSLAVNADGVVAGMLTGGSSWKAALWSETLGTQLLGTPPGPPDAYATVQRINDAGEVLGSVVAGGESAAYRWHADTGYEMLPGLQGCPSEYPLASVGGTVAGGCGTFSLFDLPHGGAWLWTAAEGTRAIFDLVDPSDPRREKAMFMETTGIDAAGRVFGSGYYKGWPVTFMLTPLEAARRE